MTIYQAIYIDDYDDFDITIGYYKHKKDAENAIINYIAAIPGVKQAYNECIENGLTLSYKKWIKDCDFPYQIEPIEVQ